MSMLKALDLLWNGEQINFRKEYYPEIYYREMGYYSNVREALLHKRLRQNGNIKFKSHVWH